MSKFDLTLNLNNIGPHSNTELKEQITSSKIAIFALNGEGKTFISRMFRLASCDEKLKDPTQTDY